jgi:NAD(P)-dependent dehydrogenase (short-subunit alcohol dehydrogenase family)
MTSPFDLTGKRALITGSGQGVGAGIAEAFAQAGAEVAINDLVPKRASAMSQQIIDAGGKAISLPFDVTDADAVAAAIADVGGVDILVNNAGNAGGDGWTEMSPFVDTVPSDWMPFITVNLFGVMNCVHSALRNMIDNQWGRVITIISDAGRVGEPNMAAYAAAKGGAAALTRSVAREVGRHGVNVNNISLGSMRTPLSEERWAAATDEDVKTAMKQYMIRRPGMPSDVAGLALYLASPAAEWITGQTIPMNGGYSVGQ